MRPLQVISQCSIAELGFDCAELTVDIDLRVMLSLSGWIQRRGRTSRVYPAVMGERPYQQRMIREAALHVAQRRNPTLVSPCGSGKSEIMAMIAASSHRKGRSCAIITPRRLLVGDMSGRLTRYGVPHSLIMGGETDTGNPTKIISFDAAISRDIALNVDLLLIDEAHLALSGSRFSFIQRHASIPRLCLTATPVRGDGQGLNRISDALVLGPSIRELIDQNFLVPCRVFSAQRPDMRGVDILGEDYNQEQAAAIMSKPKHLANAVSAYKKHGQGLPAIVHACNVAHSKAIAARFNAAGIPAIHLDAESTNDERAEAIARIRLSARPKTHSILLDCAGNVLAMGMPDDDRDWSLDDSEKVNDKPKPSALSARRCEKCWFTFSANSPKCPECGNPYVSSQKEIKEKELELVEVKRKAKESAIDRYRSNSTHETRVDKLVDLLRTADQKQYRRGWAFGRWQAIFKETLPSEIIRAAYSKLR